MKTMIMKDAKNKEVTLSKIILGGVPFGSAVTVEDSFDILDEYIRQGGNAIDTARVYCDWLPNGHNISETTIGLWIKARNNRESVQILTKGGHPKLESMSVSRLSAAEIRADLEESLECLGTDYVDLYFLHRDDVKVPVNHIMETLHSLVTSGKVRALGASNWSIHRIMEANTYAREQGLTPFTVSEIQWSLAACTPEMIGDPTLICMTPQEYEAYKELQLPVMAYTSQAGGIYSCGYQPDLSDVAPKHLKYVSPENARRYSKLLKLCANKGASPAAVSLNYILDNPISAGAVIGCSSLKQLRDSMSSLNFELTVEEINTLL